MNINYHQDAALAENRIDLFYREKDREIQGIMDYLESHQQICGKDRENINYFYPNEIFYLEIVDRRCYAYLKEGVCQIDFSLKSFQEYFPGSGFIQIGKSLVVNIYRIQQLKTDLNMKMRLILTNGEVLMLNRAYKRAFLDYLKKMKEIKHENDR